MSLLNNNGRVENVLIVWENYKTHREAANFLNYKHLNRINHLTISKILKKFKSDGYNNNNFHLTDCQWGHAVRCNAIYRKKS